MKHRNIYDECSYFYHGGNWGQDAELKDGESHPEAPPEEYCRDHITGSWSDGGWNDFLVPAHLMHDAWINGPDFDSYIEGEPDAQGPELPYGTRMSLDRSITYDPEAENGWGPVVADGSELKDEVVFDGEDVVTGHIDWENGTHYLLMPTNADYIRFTPTKDFWKTLYGFYESWEPESKCYCD